MNFRNYFPIVRISFRTTKVTVLNQFPSLISYSRLQITKRENQLHWILPSWEQYILLDWTFTYFKFQYYWLKFIACYRSDRLSSLLIYYTTAIKSHKTNNYIIFYYKVNETFLLIALPYSKLTNSVSANVVSANSVSRKL